MGIWCVLFLSFSRVGEEGKADVWGFAGSGSYCSVPRHRAEVARPYRFKVRVTCISTQTPFFELLPLPQWPTPRYAPLDASGSRFEARLLQPGPQSHRSRRYRGTLLSLHYGYISLTRILLQGRARAGQYATPEAFDRDLHHLFQVARLFIRPETPGNVYADLLVLQVNPISSPSAQKLFN